MTVSISSEALWVKAWHDCSDEQQRIKHLRALTVGKSSSPAAIAALYFSIGKAIIPGEEKIRAQYGELQARLGNKLLSHLEAVGQRFNAAGLFWSESFNPSFWKGAEAAHRIFFCQTLGLAGERMPQSPSYLGQQTPLSFDQTLVLLAERRNPSLFEHGIKVLHGHHESLLHWTFSLIASLLRDELYSLGELNPIERKELGEAEQLLFSLLDKGQAALARDDQRSRELLYHLISLQVIGIQEKGVDDRTPEENDVLLEKLRTYLTILRVFKLPQGLQESIALFSRLLHLSKEPEEQHRYAKELVSLLTNLQKQGVEDDLFYHLLCYEMLHIKDHARDLFVQYIGDLEWLSILRKVLLSSISMAATHTADPAFLRTTLLALQEFISLHVSLKRPIPKQLRRALSEILANPKLLDFDLFYALKALKGMDFTQFFLPYAVLYATRLPFVWLFVGKALKDLPSSVPQYERLMREQKPEPMVCCTLLFLYQEKGNYPPEAKEWADLLSSYVKTVGRPEDPLAMDCLWPVLEQLYLYRIATEGPVDSSRALLYQMRELFPQNIDMGLQIDILVHDLMQCTDPEDALSHLQRIERLTAQIDPTEITYLYASSLLIATDCICSESSIMPFTYHASAEYLKSCYRQLETHPKELLVQPLANGVMLVRQLKERLSPQTVTEEPSFSSPALPAVRNLCPKPPTLELESVEEELNSSCDSSSEEETTTTADDRTAKDQISPTRNASNSPEEKPGKKKRRAMKRLEQAGQPECTEFEGRLQQVLQHKQFDKRSLAKLLNEVIKNGGTVSRNKIAFPSSSKTPLKKTFHPLHAKRPVTELERFARAALESQHPGASSHN